jgi:hypothetical protein
MDITPPASGISARSAMRQLADYSSDSSMDGVQSLVGDMMEYAVEQVESYASNRYNFYRNSPAQGPFGYGTLALSSPSRRAATSQLEGRSKRSRVSARVSSSLRRANASWDKFTWLKKPS